MSTEIEHVSLKIGHVPESLKHQTSLKEIGIELIKRDYRPV